MLREFVSSNDLASVVEAGERFQFGDRYSFPKVRLELHGTLLTLPSALQVVGHTPCYSRCSVCCPQTGEGAMWLLPCPVCHQAVSLQKLHWQIYLSSRQSCGFYLKTPLADLPGISRLSDLWSPTGCADRVQVAAGTRRLLPPGFAGLLRAQSRAQPGRPGQGVARGRRAVPHAGPQGAASGRWPPCPAGCRQKKS